MRRGTWSTLVVLAGVAVAVAGCGADGSTSSPTSAGAGASGSAASACEPVGDGGGAKVAVTLDEWSVTAVPTTAPAGKVTFDVRNGGAEPHELVVVRGVASDDLSVVDGKVDEAALPDGAFIGEVEAFPAGETCSGTFELAAGSYTLFCNIVEEHEGQPESHFEEGMVTTLEVG